MASQTGELAETQGGGRVLDAEDGPLALSRSKSWQADEKEVGPNAEFRVSGRISTQVQSVHPILVRPVLGLC